MLTTNQGYNYSKAIHLIHTEWENAKKDWKQNPNGFEADVIAFYLLLDQLEKKIEKLESEPKLNMGGITK